MHWLSVVFLMAAAVAVWSWFAVEVYRFSRGKSLISGKHLALRGVIAALVLIVVLMIMWGGYRPWDKDDAKLLLTYGAACLAVGISILILALHDWRMVMREKHLKQADLYRRLDSEIDPPTGESKGM
ncbi:MAG TPA: hypothetical protein QGH10_13100 [Armatimonadota bacterium]|nr:hypothetical protein [Armatimonadota bacterium]